MVLVLVLFRVMVLVLVMVLFMVTAMVLVLVIAMGSNHHMIGMDTPGDVYIYSGATAGATKNTAGAQSVSTMLSEGSRFDLFADFVEIYSKCLSVWFFCLFKLFFDRQR